MAEQGSTHTDEVPSSIGEFQVIRILSSGVMGRTFLANDGNVHLAIKTYFPEYAQKLDYIPKFKSEIKHPNIMLYKDIKYDNKWQHFIVMDYLEVKPISNKRLYGQGHKAIVELFLQIADAVQVAHSSGVVHSNIKPSNVLIRREAKGFMPIITDFGLTYIYDETYHNSPGNFPRVFPYMAPETINTFVSGGDVHTLQPSADVYSLTVVLCEVLSGKPLFEGITARDELLEAKKNKHYRLVSVNFPTRKLNVRLLNEFVKKNLSYEPEARIPTMDKWKEELQACILAEGPVTAST